jgi:hypothetical protein
MQARNNDKLQKEIDALQRPLVGRRTMSWLAFVLVLLACLVLPVLASVWPSVFQPVEEKAPQLRKTPHPAPVLNSTYMRASPTALGLDAQWNPGTLSASHQPFGLDCKSCHSEPFKQVQDKTAWRAIAASATTWRTRSRPCRRCTKPVAPPATATIRAEGLVSQNRRYIGAGCASCHGDLESKLPGTQVANEGLRQGAPAVPRAGGGFGDDLCARAPGGPIAQANALEIPARYPPGRRRHRQPEWQDQAGMRELPRPNASGSGFERVSMQRDCQSCHALAFEPALSQRQVPHGSVPEVLTTLREFYGYVSSSKVGGCAAGQRPVFTVRPGCLGRRPASCRARAMRVRGGGGDRTV